MKKRTVTTDGYECRYIIRLRRHMVPPMRRHECCRRLLHDVHVSVRKLVPNLGVNYPNWAMGPFDFGNGLSSISVSTATYFIAYKLARENRPNHRIN